MRAMWLKPDADWLAQRKQHGLDRFDEVWEGVLHLVPSALTRHQVFERDLEHVLVPIARRQGLDALRQMNFIDPIRGWKDYRVPDIVVVRPDQLSEQGVNGCAELVVEILSPDDESYDKLPFYAKHQVPEVWIIDPHTRAAEVYVLRGASYAVSAADARGVIQAPRLALELEVVDGPKLRVAWSGGSAET